ncbi:MAG: VRR-NUC domain-containing protein [Nitrospira sp.]|nr:VRR-NUC domain-containing protein [Nitrospira sp.]
MNRLNDCDLATELTTAYQNHYGTPCRPIERWDKYPLPVLQDVIARSSRKLVLRVLHRLLENFTEHRRGLPDLVLVKDEETAFVEVKGPRDTLSSAQEAWLSMLQEWGANVWVAHVKEEMSLG